MAWQVSRRQPFLGHAWCLVKRGWSVEPRATLCHLYEENWSAVRPFSQATHSATWVGTQLFESAWCYSFQGAQQHWISTADTKPTKRGSHLTHICEAFLLLGFIPWSLVAWMKFMSERNFDPLVVYLANRLTSKLSVSRLDMLKLSDLKKLLAGSLEKIKVHTIWFQLLGDLAIKDCS